MTETRPLSERLRAEADEIAGWGAGNEAATVREAADALDAKDALLREAREALKRIVAANPRNTNAGSAEQAFSWTYAVAATALAKLE